MAYADLAQRVATTYLRQRSRLIRYSSGVGFERDTSGRTWVVLPSVVAGELRILLEKPLPVAPAYRLSVVINLDESVRLLYTVGTNEAAAERAMREAVLAYVLEEVGEGGMIRMAQQLLQQRGARLDPHVVDEAC
jgi:hypothetical protein